MMAFDYQTYLPDDILQKVDRAGMSQSLEAREPLIDHRLIEWAARLPDNYKYKNGIKKHILKEIVYKYVPRKMMNRPKMGFAVPLEQWLHNELKSKVLFHLSEKKLTGQQIFNPSFVDLLIREFYSGKNNSSTKIWRLLMFQMWYEKWME